MTKIRIAVLASGSGSNALRIMHYFAQHPRIEVGLVMSNKQDAGALQHASACGVAGEFRTSAEFRQGDTIVDVLHAYRIDAVVLAGFLLLIPQPLLMAYPNRMINIHPSLLPKYGGKGMYGHHVHEAVASAGDAYSGITIHLVDNHFDEGKPIAQFSVALELPTDAARIEAQVRQLELQHYAPTIEQWLLGQ